LRCRVSHPLGRRWRPRHTSADSPASVLGGAAASPASRDPSPPAAHDFYQETLILFSLIEDELTEEAFPSMTAGPKFEYFWQDDGEYKSPTKLPAKVYIQNLLAWVDAFLQDPAVFPNEPDQAFPENFRGIVQRIFRRLFRIYAHIYYHHWDRIQEMGADAHLNTCFKHFIFFVKRFDLIGPEELAPLDELIASFIEDHKAEKAAGGAAAGGGAGGGAASASSS